jgi:hypothetical protein
MRPFFTVCPRDRYVYGKETREGRPIKAETERTGEQRKIRRRKRERERERGGKKGEEERWKYPVDKRDSFCFSSR